MKYLILFINFLPLMAQKPILKETIQTDLQWHANTFALVHPSGNFVLAYGETTKVYLLEKSGKSVKEFDPGKQYLNIVAIGPQPENKVRVFILDYLSQMTEVILDENLKEFDRETWPKKERIHFEVSYSPLGNLFASKSATFDPINPELEVTRGLFKKVDEPVKTFSEHLEGGRLYVNSDEDMVYEFIAERVRGFCQDQAVMGFDQKGNLLVANIRGTKAVFRFDPVTGTSKDLFKPGLSQKPSSQVRGIAALKLAQVRARIPVEINETPFLDRMEKDPNVNVEPIRIWGILGLPEGRIGLISKVDMITGTQVCEVFDSTGKRLYEWETQNWGFLTPSLQPKAFWDGTQVYIISKGSDGRLQLERF